MKRQDQTGWLHYTVPEGHVAVVKSITVCNVSAGTRAIQVTIGAATVIYAPNLAVNETRVYALHQVADAGDNISCYASDTGSAVLISGFLLTSPPQAATKPVDPEQRPQPTPLELEAPAGA
jgi:hypothetical protein